MPQGTTCRQCSVKPFRPVTASGGARPVPRCDLARQTGRVQALPAAPQTEVIRVWQWLNAALGSGPINRVEIALVA